MIEIKTKIHDNFSLEIKESFVVRPNVRDNHFAVNTWIFVPNSLDINPQTYGKDQFYRDVKSNVRLITPVFLLRDIAGGEAQPLEFLRRAMHTMASQPTEQNVAEYEYQIKMFCAIAKSALRDEALHITSCQKASDVEFLTDQYTQNLERLLDAFRGLRQIINVPIVTETVRSYYFFGDEFLGHIASLYSLRVLAALRQSKVYRQVQEPLVRVLTENEAYKESMGYPTAREDDPQKNRDLVFQHGILKKYVESDLYLNLRKKKDGVAVEQILYSIAAGMAMIFATVVSFSVQKNFGSLSIPLFIALIVSYMLKDRIKELIRYYFAYRLGKKYFDNKALVKIKDQEVGWMKEGVDFISDRKTPNEVLEIRNRSALLQAENRIFDEKIILYRKLVYIDSQKLEANNVYRVEGINDIFRLHVNRFTLKMDNPQQPLQVITPDGQVKEIVSQKIYFVNLVIQVRYEDRVEYQRIRLKLTREGIQGVEKF